MQIPDILKKISRRLAEVNAQAIVVGGAVRDHFLNVPCKDYDIEVYGLTHLEELERLLSEFGSVNLVGKSFGVLKFVYKKEEYDFSFPRTEAKVGSGHRGFEVKVNGLLDFKTAAKRRDFTINAMGYDIESKAFLDPFNGRRDMKERVLRHIDDSSFVEDPLRVYRAVQFCARFGYTLAEETKVLCLQMVETGMLEELPKERVYAEWKKLLLKADKPSVGLELMQELNILKYYPELEAIMGIPQDSAWHPEGDVWIHTLMTVDAMALIVRSEERGVRSEKEFLKFMFAILCHDLGKAVTTTLEFDNEKIMTWTDFQKQKSISMERETNTPHSNVHIRAIGHEAASVPLTQRFMERLTNEQDLIASILPLVEHHLKPSQFYAQGAKAPAIRRLATKVNIEELVLVAKADFLGRTTEEAKSGVYAAGEWLLEKATALNVKEKPMDNFLQGRDLIGLGLKPSPQFRMILDEVYALQLEGTVSNKEKASEYVKKRFL